MEARHRLSSGKFWRKEQFRARDNLADTAQAAVLEELALPQESGEGVLKRRSREAEEGWTARVLERGSQDWLRNGRGDEGPGDGWGQGPRSSDLLSSILTASCLGSTHSLVPWLSRAGRVLAVRRSLGPAHRHTAGDHYCEDGLRSEASQETESGCPPGGAVLAL